MNVADYISYFLKKRKINKIFMLTGYGAMYLNDAIKKTGIKYYATRNEATAPIMASAYAKIKGGIGVACVTAGPGATNAIPGLSEAYVDSSPVMVISGQVDLKQTTYNTKLKNIRTFGTAEINILPIVKPLTKYAEIIKNPKDVKYIIEKAFYMAQNGRPGPVWIDVPLNIQKAEINLKKLKGFTPPKIEYRKNEKQYKKILKILNQSKRPIILCGNGVKASNTFKILKKIVKKIKIPILFSRAAQDLDSHDSKFIFGSAGIKGSKYCKRIMNNSDLAISLGCRLAPQLIGHDFKALSKAKIISIDVVKDELKKKGAKIYFPIKEDLKFFMPKFEKFIKNKKVKNFHVWLKNCEELKKNSPMITKKQKKQKSN